MGAPKKSARIQEKKKKSEEEKRKIKELDFESQGNVKRTKLSKTTFRNTF